MAESLPPSRILVVDDDAWILRMITSVLQKAGHIVETAHDGEEALSRAEARLPDLIICDVMMPRMDGWTFIKNLRAHGRFAFVPVIFLSAQSTDEDRIRGFRLGADDYMSKPFRLEELNLRVVSALRRRQHDEVELRAQVCAPVALQASGVPGFGGNLDQIGLSSLLIVLEMEKKSGELVLVREAVEARISVRAGSVIRVMLADPSRVPAPRGREALFVLLGWPSGRFEWTPGAVDGDDEVRLGTTMLLIEGARRMDEGRRAGSIF